MVVVVRIARFFISKNVNLWLNVTKNCQLIIFFKYAKKKCQRLYLHEKLIAFCFNIDVTLIYVYNYDNVKLLFNLKGSYIPIDKFI